MLRLLQADVVQLRRSMRLRIFISVLLACASGFFCWFLLDHFHLNANGMVNAVLDLLGENK